METEQLQRWADNAAHAAGRAFNQSKNLFYSARDKGYDAALKAQKPRRAHIKRAQAAGLPTLQDKWHGIVDHAEDSFSRFGSHMGNRFHSTEIMLLKVGGVLLAFKCFSHRHQPVKQIAIEARQHIHERPVESALIALGIGYALGKLLR